MEKHFQILFRRIWKWGSRFCPTFTLPWVLLQARRQYVCRHRKQKGPLRKLGGQRKPLQLSQAVWDVWLPLAELELGLRREERATAEV